MVYFNKNSEFVYFSGKAKWINRLFTPDIEYNCWQCLVYLDRKSLDTFEQLQRSTDTTEGIKNELKEDEEGKYHSFKRPTYKEYKDKTGKTYERHFEPPVVTDANGHPWDPRVAIGNGSDLTVTCEKYSYQVPRSKKRGTAIRMVAVRVDNLVPFDKESLNPDQKKLVKGFEQNPPNWD